MKKLSLALLTTFLSYFSYSQVSFLSTPYTPKDEYIPPVDLNLLREVNTYKQNTYQQNYNDINAKLSYLYKLLEYLPKTNWDVIVTEYNTIVQLKGNYDLSNFGYYNYFVERINYLETVIKIAIKNPDVQFPADLFTKKK